VSSLAGAGAARGDLTPVAAANTRAAGITSPNVLSRELDETAVARGSMKLENPTADVPYYGYDGDGPLVPAPGDLPAPGHKIEASKTEPDKNTYLVLPHQDGADPAYDYGNHFLFQGHETGTTGYITRVNLDADVTHRVTLLASKDVNGNALPVFDGSTWDPWAKRLLFTAELGGNGGVWQSTVDAPAKVEDVSGALGRGGYEGIQNDSLGNLVMVEDAGGKSGTVNSHAKQPNSFVYRFVPERPWDLTKGKLQVLQVGSLATPGQPITFHAGQADADITSQDTKDLNTYGKVFDTRWVTVHDTAVDGATPFDANAAAKAKGGTPFKRPENGVYRPGSNFREFFFDATGDTNALSEANAQFGGWGGIFKLSQTWPGADTGKLTLFYAGDQAHTGLDNTVFFDDHRIAFVEDAGDTLHGQRNALDSGFLWDTRLDYSKPSTPAPVRFLAEGRDPSATLDSAFTAFSGFNNEGDNEITGIHVSDGDAGFGGVLGARVPRFFQGDDDWRAFYTQQHGDNVTYELTYDASEADHGWRRWGH
jgi:hypothetical protein